MSQGAFIRIRTRQEIEKKLPFLINEIKAWDYDKPLCIKLEQYRNPRSLGQNAMSHIWYREIAQGMEKKGHKVDYEKPEEAWKLWLKKRFLGSTEITIGKHTFEKIQHTSDLNSADMAHYLDQVYHWADERGIRLSIPKESEYAEILKQQES